MAEYEILINLIKDFCEKSDNLKAKVNSKESEIREYLDINLDDLTKSYSRLIAFYVNYID